MYAPFFGLAQDPFSIAPDPRYLFMSERHREALAHLTYSLSCHGGFVLLTGEVGTGKTTICRCFLEQMPQHCNVAYIFNPKLNAVELLQAICEEFHVAPRAREPGEPLTVKSLLDPLNAFLLQAHAQGRDNVLIIDEAQNLSPEVLEQLRLLTNLETPERKLLQIILIGQPELRDIVARPELEQFAQRVVARFHLTALTERETAQYVRHRLEVAGLSRVLPFDRTALREVHRLSRGIPRRINLLCDRALLGAYARARGTVSVGTVGHAAAEIFGLPAPSRWRDARPMLLMGASALAAIGLVAGTWWGAGRAWSHWQQARAGGPATAAAQALASERKAAGARAEAGRPVRVAVAPQDAGPGATAAAELPMPAVVAGPVSSEGAVAVSAILLQDLDVAWRELAREWKVRLPAQGDPCDGVAGEQLRCFRHTLSLSLIRQLGRPGIVTLDAGSERPLFALLVSLGDDSATLRAGGVEQTVTLRALAARWRGDFATLWRVPPGYAGRVMDSERGPVVTWAARQLAAGEPGLRHEGVVTQAWQLRGRLRNFQLAQGLPVTGTLNPMTFMQLNRAAGVDEPRLRAPS